MNFAEEILVRLLAETSAKVCVENHVGEIKESVMKKYLLQLIIISSVVSSQDFFLLAVGFLGHLNYLIQHTLKYVIIHLLLIIMEMTIIRCTISAMMEI